MNLKIISIVLIAILLIGVNNHVFAEKKVSKVTQKICIHHYEKYKINEKLFFKKFSERRYFDDCMKLYKDPNWYFRGKAKIDRKY